MKKIYSLKKEILFNSNIYDILSIAIDKKFSLDGYAIKGKFKVNGEYLIKENEKDEFDIDIPYLNYIEDNYDISKIKIDIDDFYYEIKDSNILVINIDIVVDGLEEKERCIDITDEEINNSIINSKPSNDIELNINEKVNTNIDINNEVEIVEESTKDKQDIESNINNHDNINIDINNEIEIVETSSKDREDIEEINRIDNQDREDIEEINRIDNQDREDIILQSEIKEEKKEEFVTYKVCIVRENDTIETIMQKYNTSLESLKKYNIINDIKVGDKIIIPYEKD